MGRPTTVALASTDEDEARGWQEIVSGNNFRVYTGTDVIGLEVGGATKNIYAVAAASRRRSTSETTRWRRSRRAALREIMRFGAKLGASPLTLSGLAGVGDLIVTCYSMFSRNFRLGLAIGNGMSFEEAVESLGQVAEGAYHCARRRGEQQEVRRGEADRPKRSTACSTRASVRRSL